ncbi:hypothetical protein Cs7R123_63510 [Catellatospora sp. TT07R-123]|nr:hypothetical protein Cs7R123_63510 [Catellatospora sp. TT07R-123]
MVRPLGTQAEPLSPRKRPELNVSAEFGKRIAGTRGPCLRMPTPAAFDDALLETASSELWE